MTGNISVEAVEDLSVFSPIIVKSFLGDPISNYNGQCDLFINSENRNERTVVIKKNDEHLFGKAFQDPATHTLILVRNKKTNKATIYMSQSCDIKSPEEKESRKRKALEESNTESIKSDWRTRENSLIETFGSKSAKRISNISSKISSDISSKKEELKEAVADVDVKLSNLNASYTGEDMLRLLPNCNRQASTPEGVYNINDILTQEERNILKPTAEFILSTMSEMNQKASFFLWTHIKQLGPNPNLDYVALLIYANCLIQFYNMSAQAMRSKDCYKQICSYSNVIASKILKEFTVLLNSLRTRPNYCKDKIVCHIIVCILLACNFEVNIESLSTTFKGFGVTKLIQLARVVGLKAAKVGSKVYQLKTPLPPLPTPRAGPKKRMR